MDHCTRDLDKECAFKIVTSKAPVQETHLVVPTNVEVNIQPYEKSRSEFHH